MPIEAILLTLRDVADALDLPLKKVKELKVKDEHFPVGIQVDSHYCLLEQDVRKYKRRLLPADRESHRDTQLPESRISLPDLAIALGIEYKKMERMLRPGRSFYSHFRPIKIRGRWWVERSELAKYLALREAVQKTMIDLKAGTTLIGMGLNRFRSLLKSDPLFPMPTMMLGKEYWLPQALLDYSSGIKQFTEMASVQEVASLLNVDRNDIYVLVREGWLPEGTRRFGEMRWERSDLEALVIKSKEVAEKHLTSSSQKRTEVFNVVSAVLRMTHELRMTKPAIAAACGISEATVQYWRNHCRETGVKWPLPKDTDSNRLYEQLYPLARASAVARLETAKKNPAIGRVGEGKRFSRQLPGGFAPPSAP